jgi:hypothetical protein
VSGGALPILVIEKPTSCENVSTKGTYLVMGYTLDKNAAPNQGVQGTGIDRVSVFVDKERDNGGRYLGDADLAFSNLTATNTYGQQFAVAGWRLEFKPTILKAGSHQLFVYAHSVVTAKEDLELRTFNVVEK